MYIFACVTHSAETSSEDFIYGLALQISTSSWLFILHDPLVSHLQLSSIEEINEK